ncbi:MAG: hypothetical protein FJ090_18035 [Deltaproteobacteria bacterium]|nr:hypothetical protein [Deltaproteobacteria bacterium]
MRARALPLVRLADCRYITEAEYDAVADGDVDATTYEGTAELAFDEVDNDGNGTIDERELIGSGPLVGHPQRVLSPDLGHGVATLDLDGDLAPLDRSFVAQRLRW